MITPLLIQAIDQSDYDLTEWIDALHHFQNWLRAHRLKAELSAMIGYLSCCSKAAENAPIHLSLCGILDDMLETHGFEAVHPSS